MDRVREEGYRLVNADITIILERPKLRGKIDLMRETLAPILGCSTDCISVKATTTEHLGFTGREEGCASLAVCLLEKD